MIFLLCHIVQATQLGSQSIIQMEMVGKAFGRLPAVNMSEQKFGRGVAQTKCRGAFLGENSLMSAWGQSVFGLCRKRICCGPPEALSEFA